MCTTPEKCSWNYFCLFVVVFGGSGVVGVGGLGGGVILAMMASV